MSENNVDKIYAGQEASTQGASPVHKDRWLDIFLQLMESDRFKTFVNANFDIHSFVDEEAKVVHTRVIEKPPEKVMEELMQNEPELLKAMHDSEEVERTLPATLNFDPKDTGKTRQQKKIEASAPAVLSPAQLIKLHHALRTSGCKKPTAAVQKVLAIIGQQEQSLILPPSVGESA